MLVNNNLCEKLVPSLRIIFGERFKVTSVPFFIKNYNLLSCELDDFTFKVLYWVILYHIKNLKLLFASLIMKHIVVSTSRSKFLVKLICCVSFASASSACCLFKYIVINL